MNTTNKPPRRVVIAAEKITKKQIDATLSVGVTHVKFTNKNVQRRLMKSQEKIRRTQELRENQSKRFTKAYEAAKSTNPVGGHPTGAYVNTETGAVIPNINQPLGLDVVENVEELNNPMSMSPFDLSGHPPRGLMFRSQIKEAVEEIDAATLFPEVPGLIVGPDVPVPTTGFKLTDCYGGMGVVCKIADDNAESQLPKLIEPPSVNQFQSSEPYSERAQMFTRNPEAHLGLDSNRQVQSGAEHMYGLDLSVKLTDTPTVSEDGTLLKDYPFDPLLTDSAGQLKHFGVLSQATEQIELLAKRLTESLPNRSIGERESTIGELITSGFIR